MAPIIPIDNATLSAILGSEDEDEDVLDTNTEDLAVVIDELESEVEEMDAEVYNAEVAERLAYVLGTTTEEAVAAGSSGDEDVPKASGSNPAGKPKKTSKKHRKRKRR